MDRDQVIWIDPDGNELNLNDWVNYYCPRDRSGFFSQNYSFSTSKLPLSEGSNLNGITVQPIYIDLKQKVRADTPIEVRDIMRDLQYRLDPTRGKGQLKIIHSDGDIRILNCYAEGIKKDADHYTSKEMTLSFAAIEDPYWYASEASEITIENNAEAETFFSSTFFPLKLIKSSVYSTQTINNPGDVHCYPVWTITGPGEAIILSNLTTGKSLTFSDDLILEDGEVLVIDCRSLIKTVEVDGENVFEYIDSLSSLWPLIKGDNDIQVQITNSTLDTNIQVMFTPRYGSV